MRIIHKISLIALSAAFIASCTNKETTFSDPLATNRDTTVSPAENFFLYANGGWIKKNPIPGSERSNGIFRTIGDTINAQVKSICEKSAKNTGAAKGSNEQKIGDFYASGMDTVAIEKAGLSPLNAEIKKIDAITGIPSLMATIAYLHTIGTHPAFSFYVGQDDKLSSKYALFFGQGRLGMGNRDNYFNTDKEAVSLRAAYVKYLIQMQELMGSNAATAQKDALAIMQLETELAGASRKNESLRDPNKNYNKMTVAQFGTTTPNINWENVLPELGITKADSVIVGQPEYYVALNKVVKNYTIEDWKAYLKFSLVNAEAPYLSKSINDANFHFYGAVMNGITKPRPRWKKVVEQTNSSLGELIGQIYVKDYLPAGSKEKLLEIGKNISNVYADHIKNLDWMSEATKQKALLKLSKIIMKVGYPDKWKDMSALTISRSSYCANVIAADKWEYKDMAAKYGKTVNRTEWDMFPQTYNAYYNPSNNEIVVPACNILVPGFEGRMPDDAVLYGIIGSSIFGHEITHGFDDQGSQYDEKGNLNNWWTDDDLAKFNAKTKLIVNQFNKFEPLPGKFVNGNATQGENIADLGGLVMGYEAFKQTTQFNNKEKISGLTPQQRFFLAYGYAWLSNTKKEALAQQIMNDYHSPEQYRVNGPLANIKEFHEAFKIKPGSKMYQPDSLRVVIW